MTRKTTILLTAMLIALLSACTDENNNTNGGIESSPADPGTGYSERTFSVNRDGKDGGQVTLRFYDNMPTVPYIAASAYYRMMLPDKSMTVTNQGDRYLLSNYSGSAFVDVVNDVLVSSSYNDFVSLMSLTAPDAPCFETCHSPFLKYDSHRYDPAEATVTLNFRKYGIDLHDDGREVWFPFATINDMFNDASFHIAGYNGEKIVINTDEDAMDLSDVDPDFFVPAYKTVEVAEDMARFRYGELCFVIDNFYGYPGRNLLEKQGLRERGLDATLDAVSGGKETKQLLQSANQAQFVLGTDALNMLMDDGGHTTTGLSSFVPKGVMSEFKVRYEAAFATIPAAAKQLIIDFQDVKRVYARQVKTMSTLRTEKYATNLFVKSQDGQTAVFVMNSFMDLNSAGWRTYYASNHTDADWQKLVDDKKADLVVQTVEALKRARREGVRNLVLDISLNGGGEDDPTTAIVALLGDKTASLPTSRFTSTYEWDMLTRQHLIKTFAVDRNFDGIFDAQDDRQDWVGDLNIVVLTSEASFSNANVFASKMKECGYPIWGRQSGGGACCIQYYHTPDGMNYILSSCCSHWTDRAKQSVDGGIPVDKQLTNEQMYDVEYLNGLFNSSNSRNFVEAPCATLSHQQRG